MKICFYQVSGKCLYEDEDAHLPSNLVVVDHMSLVVRTVTTTSTLEKTPHSTTTKNFKKFKKVCIKGVLLSQFCFICLSVFCCWIERCLYNKALGLVTTDRGTVGIDTF